jgi:hypothetical protein
MAHGGLPWSPSSGLGGVGLSHRTALNDDSALTVFSPVKANDR